MTFHIYIYIYIYIYIIFLNEAVIQKPLFHSSEDKLQQREKQHFNTQSRNTADDDTLTHLVLVIFNCIFLRNNKTLLYKILLK